MPSPGGRTVAQKLEVGHARPPPLGGRGDPQVPQEDGRGGVFSIFSAGYFPYFLQVF